jgi:hypothetical protein
MGETDIDVKTSLALVKQEVTNIKDGITEIKSLMKDQRDNQSVKISSLYTDLSDVKTRVRILEYKSGLWGFVGGAAIVGMALLLEWLKL